MVTAYLQDRANSILQVALDENNYDETALISLKVPAGLPYYSNSPAYERVDGVIIMDGIHYNYVKRRLFNDSLEYLCIPNQEKMRLGHAKHAFFVLINDLQQPQSSKSGSNHLTAKSFLSEYWQDENCWILPEFSIQNVIFFSHYSGSLSKPGLSSPEQPPDSC